MNTIEYRDLSSQFTQSTLVKKAFFYSACKRVCDVVVAATALSILLPPLAVICLIVKLTSKGKALYWQDRIGLNGKVIYFPKIRSMVEGADSQIVDMSAKNDHENSHTFKMKNDPRITPIGRFIRKFSIDELPQLWLVLKGDLSLVGPRPALVREVEKYSLEERQRLLVKPGLTCIWQVSGRGDIPFKEQLEMDLNYIKMQSTRLDLKLLFLTIPAVISGKGAY